VTPESIILDEVAVRFRIPRETITTFKEYAIRRIQRRITWQDFWALNGVSLAIGRAEVFGIVGRNGAGKSTLLRLIAAVLRPTRGRVRVRGWPVSPLLELGAGFHPDLTGRENVYLNATLLGRSRRQVDEALPSIVDFAELHDFIEAPLRTYSSGMVARLGFSVATAWRPAVLLVDELLAVGDEQFKQKCATRIDAFRSSGVTIVLVSHSLEQIETLCDRAAWLEHGSLRDVGSAADVAAAYRADQTISQ
jgi:ABC-type polysaccharide/polyol phosphate transport system ATPase subunit